VAIACPLGADGAGPRLTEPESGAIDVAYLGMLVARKTLRLVAQHERMLITVSPPVLDALVRVVVARRPAARGARHHFIRRQHRAGLEGALRLVLVADEASRTVRSAHVPRTVEALIHGARGPMRLAHLLIARGASHLHVQFAHKRRAPREASSLVMLAWLAQMARPQTAQSATHSVHAG